ncbi:MULTISPECIES: 5-formyltetrahydrofolate cyclo-ligase [Rhodococcus]|uniref:5-formyltetrahydrofolate cyclo-ligase n=1 Tax=Rhodococcus oxybenzonivorans TaxID=1990687 RepID=A0AAE5A4H4_9NOCA|nr:MULTISPECIES: 5-formyltetrahydrofolate cyclo-ligase [Rhodococcus]MDV7243931.1 5-formyltetrahydrofolate cyclo-ligase [Rhodococcus oxybenzonivorans]MDV7263810.1 5-formyltetrahydrofolate cyclo-ligase [Rhodococcus oxybenzonivorans]MDV7274827.1 5-formyltetrahydrofolate cyclo-ligase [Rhodococcus oxybenzonivorans]MDV7335066.1 5-formyltetrahydrofolate cyclo-ligase [Rhodococcus oxybenzonivorans]MDV7345777.1 5-formyltetrahydrofolate cyclo-ligase [Rhodococcus oxybenzonivorans]
MQARSKTEWREQVLSGRRALDSGVRAAEDRALAELVTVGCAADSVVCAYVPTALEPGSVDLLDALAGIVRRVLVPVTRGPGPLFWSEYTGAGQLVDAPYGLLEPTGAVLDPEEIRTAEIVFVPALAVDLRGVRLGRGAGFYDRTLGLATPQTRLITVVRDEELVAELPEDPHDVRMGWALTPGSGLVRLGEDVESYPRRNAAE